MIKVSTTGMAVSLKTDLRFPISGQWGHGDRIIHFKKKYEKLHKRATVYSCFLHMCFLWVIFIPNLHPFPNVVVHDALYKIKKTASNAAFLGEGIFTMGYSKNYIMYWGVFTAIIIPWTAG